MVADALSCLELTDASPEQNQMGKHSAHAMSGLHKDEATHVPDATCANNMAHCCASKKDVELEKFPLLSSITSTCQKKNGKIKK